VFPFFLFEYIIIKKMAIKKKIEIKTSNLVLAISIIIILLLAGKYVKDTYKYWSEYRHSDMILVHQSSIDSLKAYIKIADSLENLITLLPDTIIIRDTIYLDTIKIIQTTPHQTIETPLIHYKDSLKIENEIDVNVNFSVHGELTTPIFWKYRPIIQKTEIIVEKPIPYPVIETIEVQKIKYSTGHYLSIIAAGNDKLFTFGVDYDFVSESKIYGLQYRRYGDTNVYGVKVGINLNTLFKK
jgi:hypothetical protein